MTSRAIDMDGSPYEVGQVVLVAVALSGTAVHIERREVTGFTASGKPKVVPPGAGGQNGRQGILNHPERHFILRQPVPAIGSEEEEDWRNAGDR